MFKLDPKPHKIEEVNSILEEAMQEGTQTNNQGMTYWKIVFAFDIETTSFTEKPTKQDHNDKRGLMYVWQLAINGRVIVGREWNEFLTVINRIVEVLQVDLHHRILIYVHNLSFEFGWIYKFFDWHKVFSIQKRKPIYALTESGIEFRCSYILTNYSLENLGKQLHKYKVEKQKDFDYSLIRTPVTKLTAEELKYAIYDCLVVSAYVKEQIESEKFIYKIPLTCTSYCRRFVRKNCLYGEYRTWKKQYRKYRALMNSLQITDMDEYMQLKRAFQGGFTHAAQRFSTFTVQDVDSYDFTSSYPYCLLSEEYPMSTGRLIDASKLSQEEFEKYMKLYCCVFDVRFHNLKPKFQYESYIPAYKCFMKVGAIENNGRIYSADQVVCTLTSVDMEIVSFAYTFDYMEVSNLRVYKKGYLPLEIIQSIIKLYTDKTTLKGVVGKETEYQVSKGLLNSVYGMMVTDIVREEIIFKDQEWSTKQPDEDKEIEKYNNSRRRFLFYPWGVFCQRHSLCET